MEAVLKTWAVLEFSSKFWQAMALTKQPSLQGTFVL